MEAGTQKKKKLGNHPYVSVIFSNTMALFVAGLFVVLIFYANNLSEIIKENIELHVYLQKNLSQDQRTDVLRAFYYDPYVAVKNNERQIFFISKEKAAQKFIKETGEDFLKFLGENPLRDAYIIKIDAEYAEKSQIQEIKSRLEVIDGVFEVTYVESLIDSINTNLKKISLILVAFSVLLFWIVFILINSSIKLAMYSQRFLIRSMQLVGATSFFIQRPFLWRSMYHGFFSGILATLMLYGALSYAYYHIPELQMLERTEQLLILFITMAGAGAIIGVISSYMAVSKYLKMKLSDLY